jgi:hypothetical protein
VTRVASATAAGDWRLDRSDCGGVDNYSPSLSLVIHSCLFACARRSGVV